MLAKTIYQAEWVFLDDESVTIRTSARLLKRLASFLLKLYKTHCLKCIM